MDRRVAWASPLLAVTVVAVVFVASQSGLGAGGAPGATSTGDLTAPGSADPGGRPAPGSTSGPLLTGHPTASVSVPPSGGPGSSGPTSESPITSPSFGSMAPTAPAIPTAAPTANVTSVPTAKPTAGSTFAPTSAPTSTPTSGPTSAPSAAPTPGATPTPSVNPAPCTVFPSTNVWNRRVDDLPVAANSATMIAAIGLNASLHPDFSSTAWNGGLGYGIPVNKVNLSTPRYPVSFYYDDESDPGPYPIPSNPKIEGGSDAHLIAWDTEACFLYEIFDASKSGGQWYGGSGAIWDLRSNALRPNGWTSADAAGLPILPGLVRYEEVAAGAIRHALRFTAPRTCPNHIYPARHHAGSYSCSTHPPMGLRVRLKASVDISGFGPRAQVILLALKRYGMLLADNGSPWYVTGAPHASWDDDELHDFHELHGSDFEVVDTSDFR